MATVVELVGPEGTLVMRSYSPMHLVLPARELLLNRITEYLLVYGTGLAASIEVRVGDGAARPTAERWRRLAPQAVKIVENWEPQ
jgi:hypothetical protein